MRFFLMYLLLVSLSLSMLSQDIRLEMGYGFGSYSMKEMKLMNEALLKELPVKAKITDNFPVTDYFSISLIPFSHKNVLLGVAGSYHSTGSRINYSDFSGEYTLDNIASCFQTALVAEFVMTEGKVYLSEINQLSYLLTNLKINEKVLSSSTRYKLRSGSFLFEPGFRLAYRMEPFELALRLSLALDTKGVLHLKNEKDRQLINPKTDEKVSSDWSGIRFAVSIGYIK